MKRTSGDIIIIIIIIHFISGSKAHRNTASEKTETDEQAYHIEFATNRIRRLLMRSL